MPGERTLTSNAAMQVPIIRRERSVWRCCCHQVRVAGTVNISKPGLRLAYCARCAHFVAYRSTDVAKQHKSKIVALLPLASIFFNPGLRKFKLY
jgi:hypothetical protein